MTYNSYQIYCAFRRAQSLSKGTPYRLPKDWSKQQDKMSEQNLNALERTAGYFNTTYSNVDLEEYMNCGFELYKGFTYTQLLKKEVIQHYITKDKSRKRQITSSKDTIDNTFSFIEEYMSDKTSHNGYGKLQSFCKFRSGEIREVINFYNRGNIDQITLVYCINKRYITLSDDEKAISPYIVQRYRELLESLKDLKSYIEQKEMEL